MYFFLGKPTIEPIISSLEENSPAQNSGLMVGDKIVKISEATKLIDQGICLIAHTLPQSKLEDLLANTKDSKSLVVIKPLYQFGGNDI